MIDLSKIDPEGDANAGFDLVLHHPVDNDPLDVSIRILGHDSTAFSDTQLKQRRRSFSKPAIVDPEEADKVSQDEAMELLLACTVGWKGLSWEGKPLPFSKENAEMVYRARKWIKLQVENAVLTRANFKRG